MTLAPEPLAGEQRTFTPAAADYSSVPFPDLGRASNRFGAWHCRLIPSPPAVDRRERDQTLPRSRRESTRYLYRQGFCTIDCQQSCGRAKGSWKANASCHLPAHCSLLDRGRSGIGCSIRTEPASPWLLPAAASGAPSGATALRGRHAHSSARRRAWCGGGCGRRRDRRQCRKGRRDRGCGRRRRFGRAPRFRSRFGRLLLNGRKAT